MLNSESFTEAQHAVFQIRSIVNVAQECFNSSEDVYNILGLIKEKIDIVEKFFDEPAICPKNV